MNADFVTDAPTRLSDDCTDLLPSDIPLDMPDLSGLDPDLTKIIRKWDDLPASIRRAILILMEAF